MIAHSFLGGFVVQGVGFLPFCEGVLLFSLCSEALCDGSHTFKEFC